MTQSRTVEITAEDTKRSCVLDVPGSSSSESEYEATYKRSCFPDVPGSISGESECEGRLT